MFDTICDTKLTIELIADDTNDEIADNALAVPETIELTKLAIALIIVDTMLAPKEKIELIPDAMKLTIAPSALAVPLMIDDTKDAIVETMLLIILAPNATMLAIVEAIHVTKLFLASISFIAIDKANCVSAEVTVEYS